jgi:hypothetical protein
MNLGPLMEWSKISNIMEIQTPENAQPPGVSKKIKTRPVARFCMLAVMVVVELAFHDFTARIFIGDVITCFILMPVMDRFWNSVHRQQFHTQSE